MLVKVVPEYVWQWCQLVLWRKVRQKKHKNKPIGLFLPCRSGSTLGAGTLLRYDILPCPVAAFAKIVGFLLLAGSWCLIFLYFCA